MGFQMRKNHSDRTKASEDTNEFVRIEFMGFLRSLAKVSKMRMKVQDGISLNDLCHILFKELGEEFQRALVGSELQDPRVNSLILVNGQEVSVLKGLETPIKAGDTITFIPVSHGG
jgi:molybdopterin converting factor small subunit